MKLYYKLFNWLGAPVYMHFSMLFVFAFYYFTGGLLVSLISGLAFILLMLFHEMGHAYYVRKYHHELLSIRLFIFHGVCEYQYDSRWLPETLIHAGGLIAQVLVLIVWLAVLGLVQLLKITQLASILDPITIVFVYLNIFTFVLNSLPIKGLDGYELWGRFYDWLKIKTLRIKTTLRKRRAARAPSPEKIVELAIKKAKRNSKG